MFLIAFVAAVPLPALLVIFGRDQGAWVVVLAGVAGMLLTRLDDIEMFTLGPLKAQLRREVERAKDAADLANATVEQLRRLGLALSRPTLSKTLVTPRLDDHSTADQYRDRDQIVSVLRALGASSEDIEIAVKPFNVRAEMDHQDAIVAAARAGLEDNEKWSRTRPFEKFVSGARERVALGETVPASEFEKVAEEMGFRTDAVREAVADLAHFQRHRALRRPETFPGPHPT